jgi:hypothetical protein
VHKVQLPPASQLGGIVTFSVDDVASVGTLNLGPLNTIACIFGVGRNLAPHGCLKHLLSASTKFSRDYLASGNGFQIVCIVLHHGLAFIKK